MILIYFHTFIIFPPDDLLNLFIIASDSAEDFCVGFLTMKRGKLIGSKTAGSSGSTLMFNLPGDGLALICTKEDFFPNGK